MVAIVAEARGLEVDLRVEGASVSPSRRVSAAVDGETARAVASGPWGPWLPGFVREALQPGDRRHRLGIHHTPPVVIEEILDLVAAHGRTFADVAHVLDPAAGGGAFLLAVGERLALAPPLAVERMWAVDVDALALATTVAALTLWAGAAPRPERMLLGDFLSDAVQDALPPSIDLVVGNPPFRSPLRSDTMRDGDVRARLRRRWPGVGRHVDDAAAFLLAGAERCGEAGVLAMVQPDSVLGATDARPVRERVARIAPLRALWIDRSRSFAAGVDTVAVVAGGRSATGADTTVLVSGRPRRTPDPSSWAPLLAGGRGVPHLERPVGPGTLGDIAVVTAGFRDHYYGLVGAVREDPEAAVRLVTVGLIDPLRLAWGRRSCRFAKRTFLHPGIDLDWVDGTIADWVRRRLRPKVLVASQTRVIEAVADPDGVLVPSVPVVSVEPTDAAPSLGHVLAVLTCPVATVLTRSVAAGTALSADAVRVSASGLSALPLPSDRVAWDTAAAAATAGDVTGCGAAMLAAHGLAHRGDVLDFWLERLPS